MPNASPLTTDAPELGRGSRHRSIVVGVAVSFVAVLGVAVALGLLLQSFLAFNGSTTLDRHITDWFFTWRTNRGLIFTTRVSYLGGPILVIPVTAAVTLGLVLVHRWRLALYYVVTVVGAAVLNVLARAIVDARKPPGELGLLHPFPSSFPSGHAAEAAAISVGLGVVVVVLTRSRTIRVLVWSGAAVVIVAVGAARVYLAVHWTTDVLVGITIGTLWALGTARAFGLRAPPADSGPDPGVDHGRG